MKSPVALLSAIALLTMLPASAQAALVNEGNGLIYDTVTNVTWTQDANLFGTMLASNSKLVNDIIAADPVIYDTPNAYDNPTGSGTYQVSQVDFYPLGSGGMTWYGAQAFVGYLNHIAYKGHKTWALPSADTSCAFYAACSTGQLGELFWGEIPPALTTSYMNGSFGPFTDVEKTNVYWTGTQYQPNPSYAWKFSSYDGSEGAYEHNVFGNAWVMLAGNVAAVPEPAEYAMLLAGICLVGLVSRKKSNNS